MKVISLYGHTFDLDQIVSSQFEGAGVVLTFRNADRIHLAWRDSSERAAVLNALELRESDGAENRVRP